MKIILLCLLPVFLMAHKVNLFGELKGENLYLTGYFTGGGACQKCKVRILDEEENVILESRLDAGGEGNFHIGYHDVVHVILDASLGHAGTLVLKNRTRRGTDMEVEAVSPSAAEKKTRMLEQERREIPLEKVLCALGYLFGIFGLWALFKRKRV